MLKAFLNAQLRRPYLSCALVLSFLAYGWFVRENLPVDAIPDIGEKQVIVVTEWPGQSPKDVEDQISYPLSVAMLSVPKATSVRAKSLFGFSFVQVTFEERTDDYWARTRVAEQLATVADALPTDARTKLGPDATGLGQIFYYVLQPSEPTDLVKLRSLQDYVVKYALQSVPGVAEVASIGGYEREYHVELDPDRLRHYGIALPKVVKALRQANSDVGAKTLEQSGMEYIVRGRGYLGGGLGSEQTLQDIEMTVVRSRDNVPLYIKDLGRVSGGTGFRRGALDLNGAEAVGGIVIMRLGENPRKVIEAVKEKVASLEPSLGGVKIAAIYDRTELIDETVDTLNTALWHELLITILVVILFLANVRSSLVVASVLPISVLATYVAMDAVGLDANIMSLGGIAIAIGNMVDLGIVFTENIYARLQNAEDDSAESRRQSVIEATREVAPAVLTATATTVLSFLPVFLLTGRDFKLFAPLAATKSFALLGALAGALVLVPLLAYLFLRKSEQEKARHHALQELMNSSYRRVLNWSLDHPRFILALPALTLALGLAAWAKIDNDDWIALDEGSLFYMPTLYPGASFTEALGVLQTQGQRIREVPEVKDVLGKIGRADTALDPAPAAMIETYIMLKDRGEWREGYDERKIWDDVTAKATMPGVTPAAYLQPIEGRVVMLQSGIKASMAIRVLGDDLEGLAQAAQEIAEQLKTNSLVADGTVNPDLVLGKPYVEFTVDRMRAARYDMTVGGLNQVIAAAVGGIEVTRAVEGRERNAVLLRYDRPHRASVAQMEKIPVVTPSGAHVPVGALADVESTWGPAGISSENARLVAHVTFAPSGEADPIATVERIVQQLNESRADGQLSLPTGYEIEAVGSFENQIEANRRLSWVIPGVILLNLLILYLMFASPLLGLVALSGVPLAFGGGMALLWLSGLEINTAIWVGFIALFGIAVDNGVILLSYLKQQLGRDAPGSLAALRESVLQGAERRLRPCLMTTATTLVALLPVIFASGRGAEIAQGMALPIFGGMFSALLALLFVPVAFERAKRRLVGKDAMR